MGLLQRGIRVFRCAKTYSQSRWCSSQSASPARGALPLLMLPPSSEGGKGVTAYNLYSPASKKVMSIKKRGDENDRSGVDESKVVGSSHGWVARFNEKREHGDLFLWEPFSGRQIKLPPIETLPDAYHLTSGNDPASVTKVIISCSPDEEEEECCAMMIYGAGQKLAFCRPFANANRSPPRWTRIGNFCREEDGMIYRRAYEEFVYSSSLKLFFCLTQHGELEAWDDSAKLKWRADLPNLPWEEEEKKREEYSGVHVLNYLVFDEQSAQLLLVKRYVMDRMDLDGTSVERPEPEDDLDIVPDEYGKYPHKTIDFEIRRVVLDNKGIRLSRPRTAGLSIFLGINQSFAISAPRQLKSNAIYFTDPLLDASMFDAYGNIRENIVEEILGSDWEMDEPLAYGGHDIGVFNYKNRTFSPCYYPCDVSSLKKISPPPYWLTPTHS